MKKTLSQISPPHAHGWKLCVIRNGQKEDDRLPTLPAWLRHKLVSLPCQAVVCAGEVIHIFIHCVRSWPESNCASEMRFSDVQPLQKAWRVYMDLKPPVLLDNHKKKQRQQNSKITHHIYIEKKA